mmetsp:Transcript_10718/g.23859  ORF Transcript_10718/g.23859 Transcript_10718/m.23859 type:complete len:209 (+) Transcript_10718:217-843(+)
MSTVATADTRNLEWKSNNIGSKMLSKMGWKEGQGIGKRRRNRSADNNEHDDDNSNHEEPMISTEGLRVKRRADGLGLGASSVAVANHNNHSHVADFHNLLADLNEQQQQQQESDEGGDNNNKKRKKKKRKTSSPTGGVTFATNKSTHAKVRKAKFREKTADDYKSIFAGADVFGSLAASETTTARSGKKEKKKSKKDKKKSKAEKREE